MIGIGMDLCEIVRIENAIQKNAGFLERYYTADERAYLARRHNLNAESAAAMFAAKEAFLKAIGAGLSGGVPMCDIGVAHADTGAPSYALTGAAAQRFTELGATRAHLSLTHEAGVAGAVCVVE